MNYESIICGGTFDHLHVGHKKFLKYAFKISEKVLIGIASDFYIKKNKKNLNIEKFAVRLKNLKHFLKTEKLLNKTKIVILNNIFEKEIFDNSHEAILVTEETKSGALLINKALEKNNFKSLKIVIFEDFLKNNLKISSSLIRNGEVDKSGEFFLNEDWFKKNLVLPEKLKFIFREPLGEIINPDIFDFSKIDGRKTIAVGDQTTLILNKKKVNQTVSVLDFKIKRETVFSSLKELGFFKKEKIVLIENKAGQINKKVWQAILDIKNNFFKKNRIVLKVEGEEDLLVLPFILILPLGFYLFYGQPNEGMVYLKINLNLKRIAKRLIGKLNY